MTIEIKELKTFDKIAHLVEEVQNLHATFNPTLYKPFQLSEIREVMEKMLSDETCVVLLAQENQETIGYLLAFVKDIPETAFYYSHRLLHIDQLSVSKEHQHKGIGSLLMNKIEEKAQGLSIARLELDHLNSNTTAATFFKSKGYLPYRHKLGKQLG
ncbi:MAG: hypothetical protein CFE21_10170 [Bacteroidetes bacterium B1(2017)]|nr:MAG: hypothetical protein CFE21_10170 [Bacteroidetes bacterium B1(2017)]